MVKTCVNKAITEPMLWNDCSVLVLHVGLFGCWLDTSDGVPSNMAGKRTQTWDQIYGWIYRIHEKATTCKTEILGLSFVHFSLKKVIEKKNRFGFYQLVFSKVTRPGANHSSLIQGWGYTLDCAVVHCKATDHQQSACFCKINNCHLNVSY